MSVFGSEVHPDHITLHFQGKNIFLTLQPSGDYKDDDGNLYSKILFDPGFAGIEPFETGTGDPLWKVAKEHDAAFERAKLGYQLPGETRVSVAKKFAGGVLTEMLKSAYVLVFGIPYILIGGIGGMFRYGKGK